jgi:hypothetical protein
MFFYEVYNNFVLVFKKVLLGENTSRISNQATIFLEKKRNNRTNGESQCHKDILLKRESFFSPVSCI